MALILRIRRTFARLHELLAGSESPTRAALPAGEFLHPLPLLALLVLVLNDWFLKGSGLLPSALTGKLSDLAGLLFFPLLLTSAFDTLIYYMPFARRLDPSLRRRKLAIAIGSTALLFVLVKLNAKANQWLVDAIATVGLDAKIVLDPSDLWTLPVLALSWMVGRAEIARMPRARLGWLLRRLDEGEEIDLDAELEDLIASGASPSVVRDLARSIRSYSSDKGDDEHRACVRNLRLLRDLSLD